ncbi:transmembrane protein 260 isoform X2 [Denticeps clupeoides]|nr:transmembrane protein 260 isoform X2 [Denticeps clupeoides]
MLCYTVCRVSGPGPGGVLAGGVFSLSSLVWRWSVVAEVFSLNNLFIGLIFCLSACFHTSETSPERKKFALWGALCCGLGLCNQHTLVLYIGIIIPWAMNRLFSHKELTLHTVVSLGLCFLAGFLPYLYLPLSSYLNVARWSWGDQTSVSGLLTHLLRAEYGTFSLAKSEGSLIFAQMLRAQWDHCVSDLSPAVLLLAALSLLICSSDRRYHVFPWLIVAMVTVYSVFFAWRANLDINKPLLLGVVERFWLQADAGLCVLAGLGLNWSISGLEGRVGWVAMWSAGWILNAGLLSHMLQSNYRQCDQSRNHVVETFAHEVLFSFPEDSLILTRGDLPGNTMRYLHLCQGARPDLRLVDQEMMTYSWYVAKLSRHITGVNFPGRWWDPVNAKEKKTFNLEQFLKHNSQRPVFACIGLPEGDPSWEGSFSRWPWGVCEQLVPSQTPFHPEEWVRRTRNLYNWSEPHNSFHPVSWEKVANDEMWQARMKTAFFLFDLAEKNRGQVKSRLYELSYNLYCEIVDGHSDYPPNWDKNLALACERLLRSGSHVYSTEDLLDRSIRHFRRYLEKDPTDPQNQAIQSAIAHLRGEKQRLNQREVKRRKT